MNSELLELETRPREVTRYNGYSSDKLYVYNPAVDVDFVYLEDILASMLYPLYGREMDIIATNEENDQTSIFKLNKCFVYKTGSDQLQKYCRMKLKNKEARRSQSPNSPQLLFKRDDVIEVVLSLKIELKNGDFRTWQNDNGY